MADIADRLSDTDLNIIQDILDECARKGELPITAGEIFKKVSTRIELLRSVFCPALSGCIVAGRIKGFHSVRRLGILQGEVNKPEQESTEEKPYLSGPKFVWNPNKAIEATNSKERVRQAFAILCDVGYKNEIY